MNFLDFEKPIADLSKQLDQLNQGGKRELGTTQEKIRSLEFEIKEKQKEIYSQLSVWQRVLVSRHPDRPYTLFYVDYICDTFIELSATGILKMIKPSLAAWVVLTAKHT